MTVQIQHLGGYLVGRPAEEGQRHVTFSGAGAQLL